VCPECRLWSSGMFLFDICVSAEVLVLSVYVSRSLDVQIAYWLVTTLAEFTQSRFTVICRVDFLVGVGEVDLGTKSSRQFPSAQAISGSCCCKHTSGMKMSFGTVILPLLAPQKISGQ
jgi:hypothetical protein